MFYLYGSTGVGKTYYGLNKYDYENVYVVDNYKNPFDGYNYEDNLLLYEFHSQITLPETLRLLDKYPMKLRSVITTNEVFYKSLYNLKQTTNKKFIKDKQENKKTFEALFRRIKNQINFDNKADKDYFIKTVHHAQNACNK
ncbi:MAG: hypothetical protein LBU04_06640 [Christensenellaceae bacterium]|nr:hypothetical protein [Christensenellaceae bacterium]